MLYFMYKCSRSATEGEEEEKEAEEVEKKVFKEGLGVVPPASCSVNDLSVWCKRSPCDAPAWAEAGVGRKEGKEKKLLDRGIFNDPQGQVTMAQADVRYLGTGSLPPPPLPPPPTLLPSTLLPSPCPFLKEAAKSTINKQGGSDCPTRYNSSVRKI